MEIFHNELCHELCAWIIQVQALQPRVAIPTVCVAKGSLNVLDLFVGQSAAAVVVSVAVYLPCTARCQVNAEPHSEQSIAVAADVQGVVQPALASTAAQPTSSSTIAQRVGPPRMGSLQHEPVCPSPPRLH